MGKMWHIETCLKSQHTMKVWPDCWFTFGKFGTSFWFGDARFGGKVHGIGDYGDPILHEWIDYGMKMTVEKMRVSDPSRVITDDYGNLLYKILN